MSWQLKWITQFRGHNLACSSAGKTWTPSSSLFRAFRLTLMCLLCFCDRFAWQKDWTRHSTSVDLNFPEEDLWRTLRLLCFSLKYNSPFILESGCFDSQIEMFGDFIFFFLNFLFGSVYDLWKTICEALKLFGFSGSVPWLSAWGERRLWLKVKVVLWWEMSELLGLRLI